MLGLSVSQQASRYDNHAAMLEYARVMREVEEVWLYETPFT